MLEAVFAFGAISLISLLLLVRESRLLYDETLILDNHILAEPSALISMPGRQMRKDAEETAVSIFGILIGSEIYRWDLDGYMACGYIPSNLRAAAGKESPVPRAEQTAPVTPPPEEETPPTATESGGLWASGAGTIRLTLFYELNRMQYAVGTMDTPDGIPALASAPNAARRCLTRPRILFPQHSRNLCRSHSQ